MGNKKLFLLVSIGLCVASACAYAECFGSEHFQNCWDDNGNSYEISRFGNTTEVSGYNSHTGSRWSETATTFGHTTNIEGRSSNGNRWHEDITNYGNTTTIEGRDSYGRSFNYNCYKIGGTVECN